MKYEEIETIHMSLVNGQRKQMAAQMEEYGMYDVFSDYSNYLLDTQSMTDAYSYLADAVNSYFKIKNR